MKFSSSLIPKYTTLIAPLSLKILSAQVRSPLNLLLHASIVVYKTMFSGSTSPIRSSGGLYLWATLMQQHCSACVLPASPRESLGNSRGYPEDEISIFSASMITAPTQNFVDAGGERRALARTFS
ncbi:hypothetical protein N7G274_005398 [Stereocaulon virgatum]|uniref:Uncharacterized protein n=1 Tax=Stereocaulon virgatum TaxID=373712 RepID=A0ABR4AA54_9LECA